jgi:hypothetical protein
MSFAATAGPCNFSDMAMFHSMAIFQYFSDMAMCQSYGKWQMFAPLWFRKQLYFTVFDMQLPILNK